MMRGTRESAPYDRGASQTVTKTATDELQVSRQTPTQKERCRRMLTRNWTCSIDFLNGVDGYPPILRYTARIGELRQEGWYVDRRPCQNTLHRHGRNVQLWEWMIVGHVDDGTLPGIG